MVNLFRFRLFFTGYSLRELTNINNTNTSILHLNKTNNLRYLSNLYKKMKVVNHMKDNESTEILRDILSVLKAVETNLTALRDTVNTVIENQERLHYKVEQIERNTTTTQIATNHTSQRVDELHGIVAMGFADTQKVIVATSEVAAATQLQEGSTFGLRKEVSELKSRMAKLEMRIKASGNE